MKKLKFIVIALVICVALSVILVACSKTDDLPDYDIFDLPYDAFFADEYRDLAADVHLNTEKYPELKRQGLRLVTGYSNGYAQADEAIPDTDEVIQNSFDPNKGILVIINGLQLNIGRTSNANMQSDSRLEELELFKDVQDIKYFTDDPDSHQIYDLGKYWKDNGYNVFYFHWEMFADHYSDAIGGGIASSPDEIQERVWSTDSGVQATYVNEEGKPCLTEPNQAVNGSIAELLAADYLRMTAAIKRVYPDYTASKHDVRFAGHSMGGLLTVAGATLLNVLADAGKLDKNMAPNRLALMDSYLGKSAKKDYTISWSGKKYIVTEQPEEEGDQTWCCNYLAALKLLVKKYTVACEFYCNEGFVVPFLAIPGSLTFDEEYGCFLGARNVDYINTVLYYCPIITIRPYFSAVGGEIAFNGHNPVREWYLSSFLYDAPVTEEGVTVPTARMSDKDVMKLRGNYFVMRNDRRLRCETVRCDDDTFALNVNE